MEAKFSLIRYLKQQETSGPGSAAARERGGREELVSRIRESLLAAAVSDSEDALRHMEIMNRAVLGYARERKQLKLRIQELLHQARVFDDTDPSGQFPSLTDAIFAEIVGLDVLELVMHNREQLEEIQVVGRDIYEIRGGREYRSPYRFRSVQELERIQQNLVLYNRDAMHYGKRWAEVQLNDGSRVTMTGFGFTAEPTLTIRFYHHRAPTLDEFAETNAMDRRTAMLLRNLIRERVNIVIIGPTNSGKTMLMKALIAEMPDEERIVTIEPRRELMISRDFPRKNVVEFEVDEDDPRHSGAQAFKLALRQSPRRIIHAEVRDADANLYVRACTRGHPGSMTTLHASALEDVPATLADMCMLDGRVADPGVLTRRIARYVTQVGIETNLVNGVRRIVRIARYRVPGDEIVLEDLVRFDTQTNGYRHSLWRKEAG